MRGEILLHHRRLHAEFFQDLLCGGKLICLHKKNTVIIPFKNDEKRFQTAALVSLHLVLQFIFTRDRDPPVITQSNELGVNRTILELPLMILVLDHGFPRLFFRVVERCQFILRHPISEQLLTIS